MATTRISSTFFLLATAFLNSAALIQAQSSSDALFPDAGNAYASGYGTGSVDPFGVYVSSDAGATWTALNDGFDPVLPLVVAFAAKDGFLFAATASDGIWRRPL